MAALQREARRDVKKLLEDQPHLRRGAEGRQLFDRIILRRQMHSRERPRPLEQSSGAADGRREAVGDVAVERRKRRRHQAPQNARAEPAKRLVNRHHAAHFERFARLAFGQDFKLRLDDL